MPRHSITQALGNAQIEIWFADVFWLTPAGWYAVAGRGSSLVYPYNFAFRFIPFILHDSCVSFVATRQLDNTRKPLCFGVMSLSVLPSVCSLVTRVLGAQALVLF